MLISRGRRHFVRYLHLRLGVYTYVFFPLSLTVTFANCFAQTISLAFFSHKFTASGDGRSSQFRRTCSQSSTVRPGLCASDGIASLTTYFIFLSTLISTLQHMIKIFLFHKVTNFELPALESLELVVLLTYNPHIPLTQTANSSLLPSLLIYPFVAWLSH